MGGTFGWNERAYGHDLAIRQMNQRVAGQTNTVVPVVKTQPLEQLGMVKPPVGHEDHVQARRQTRQGLLQHGLITGIADRGAGMLQYSPSQGNGSAAIDERGANQDERATLDHGDIQRDVHPAGGLPVGQGGLHQWGIQGLDVNVRIVYPTLEAPGMAGGLFGLTLHRLTPTRQAGLPAHTQAHDRPRQSHQAANIAPRGTGQV